MINIKRPPIKRIAYVAAIPAALIGGTAIGLTANPADMEPEVITEEVEVIKEVEAEPEVITETVTEEVEVEVTPEECANALTSAEDIFDIYSEGLMISSEVMTSYDIEFIDQKTVELEELTVELENELLNYYLSAGECQA